MRLLALGIIATTASCSSSESHRGSTGDGGGSGGGTRVEGPIAEADFPDEFVAAACSTMSRCCETSEAQCVLGMNMVISLLLPAPGARVEYDEQAAADCLDQLLGLDCEAGGDNSACQRVYRGTIAPGEACETSLQSLASECAAPEGGEAQCDPVSGLCVALSRGVAGDSCSRSCEDGPSGPYCYLSGTSPEGTSAVCWREDGLSCQQDQCAPLSEAGAACDSHLDCVAGLVCAADVCTEPLPLGAACESGVFGEECGDAGFCESSSLTCTPKRAGGEQCTFDEECLSDWCDFDTSTCDPAQENDICNSGIL